MPTAGLPSEPGRVHPRFAAAEYGQDSQFHLHTATSPAAPWPTDSGKNPDNRINVADTSGLAIVNAYIRIACSKGTYIRALARDLGEALGSGAHLRSLCRTKSGGFTVETALDIDQAIALLSI